MLQLQGNHTQLPWTGVLPAAVDQLLHRELGLHYGNKFDSLPVGGGLHPLPPPLLLDRVSVRIQVVEGFSLCGLRISCLLFVNDVVHLTRWGPPART